MKGNPVGWFEIYVQDIERARRFYESVFDCQLMKLDTQSSDLKMWGFPMEQQQYGSSGALVKMKGFPSGNNSTIVYFHSEDCSVEEGRVASAGGAIQRSKMSIGEYGFISLVIDSEGNMIGIHSMK